MKDITDSDALLRINYWRAKSQYQIGNYKEALAEADKQVQVFSEEYPEFWKEISKEGSSLDKAVKQKEEPTGIVEIKEELDEHIIYIVLKYRLLQARLNKAIHMSHIAHDICNSIMLYVKKQLDLTPKKYWLVAVKAAEVHGT